MLAEPVVSGQFGSHEAFVAAVPPCGTGIERTRVTDGALRPLQRLRQQPRQRLPGPTRRDRPLQTQRQRQRRPAKARRYKFEICARLRRSARCKVARSASGCGRRAYDGLYQRTVVIFWKPRAGNTWCEAGRVLQFKQRSSPALGNLGHFINAWPRCGSRCSQRRSLWR